MPDESFSKPFIETCQSGKETIERVLIFAGGCKNLTAFVLIKFKWTSHISYYWINQIKATLAVCGSRLCNTEFNTTLAKASQVQSKHFVH